MPKAAALGRQAVGAKAGAGTLRLANLPREVKQTQKRGAGGAGGVLVLPFPSAGRSSGLSPVSDGSYLSMSSMASSSVPSSSSCSCRRKSTSSSSVSFFPSSEKAWKRLSTSSRSVRAL